MTWQSGSGILKAGLVENDLAVEVGDVVRYIDLAHPNDVLTVQITRER